jgi:trimethylamine:corrinoid methyltransferase-like protein
MKKTGSKTMTERAYEAVAKILEEHQPHPLPDGAGKTSREMVNEFEKEQGAKK